MKLTGQESRLGIILFGLNVQSYKFALGKSLLELADSEADFIPLEKLAEPYSRHMVQHIKGGCKQGTAPTSKFIEACKKHCEGELSHDKLMGITTQLGFQNVIDAFHNIDRKAMLVPISLGSECHAKVCSVLGVFSVRSMRLNDL